MKNKKVVAFFVLFFATAFASAEPRLLSIPFVEDKVVLQGPKSQDCGPTAIFNAITLGSGIGNKSLEKIRQSLPGATKQEKYSYLMQEISQRPSQQFPGLPRTSASGTGVDDMRLILADLSQMAQLPRAPLRGGYLNRVDDEGFGAFPRRIHAGLRQSILRGVPVVMAYAGYSFGSKFGGHYVTVIGVQEQTEADGSFSIEAFDQLANKIVRFRVFEERIVSFQAYIWEGTGPREPVRPRMPEGITVNSPFLKISSKDLSRGSPGGGQPMYLLEKAFADE